MLNDRQHSPRQRAYIRLDRNLLLLLTSIAKDMHATPLRWPAADCNNVGGAYGRRDLLSQLPQQLISLRFVVPVLFVQADHNALLHRGERFQQLRLIGFERSVYNEQDEVSVF